jgi:hexokinase
MAIVDLLTQGKTGSARAELLAIAGIAASVIADQAPKDAAIIVTCDGPRTRIYCIFDDDAVEGSDANEDALGFDPLKGDWLVSLPCLADDLAWVQSALKKHSARITARDLDEAQTSTDEASTTKSQTLVFDSKGFLGS